MTPVRILRALSDVHRVRDEWEELHRRAAPEHPFLAPAWVLNWWRAYGGGEDAIRFVTVREAGDLVGVAPLRLEVERRWGMEIPTLRLWADAYANRAGPLVDPLRSRDAVEGIAEALLEMRDWGLAALDPVELTDPAVLGLASAFEARGVPTGFDPGYTSPFMTLPEGEMEPLATVSRAFGRTLRRKLNRAEREGCEVTEPGPDPGVDLAFGISRASWQHRNGTGLDTTPANEAFFRGMASDPWLRERLEILVLSREGDPLAYEWNLRTPARLFNLKVGYREEEGALSPGLVLRHHAVARALAAGLREFDFLGEVERYKMHWATGTRPHGTLLAYRGGPRLALVHGIRHRLRPALKRSPLLVRLIRLLRGDTEGEGS